MKKILIGCIAVILAVTTAFAIIPAKKQQTFDTRWYEYVAGPIHEEGSYIPMDGEPVCDGPNGLCAVKVQLDGSGNPDFSTFLDSRNKD